MKKLRFSLLLSAVLCGCGGHEFTISGKFDLTPGDTLYVKDIYHNDSVLCVGVVNPDNSFALKSRFTEPAIVSIYNQHQQLIYPDIFLEPGEIRIVEREQGGYQATGTPLNDSLNIFNNRLVAITERYKNQKMTQHVPDFIPARLVPTIKQGVDANADNLLGIFIFQGYEFPRLSRDSAGAAEARARLEKFTPTLLTHPMSEKVLRELEIIENTLIGKPYTALTLPDPKGEPVALSGLIGPGRWVLIEFWATWCGPCMAEVPYLEEAYKSFNERGFEIYGISLDNDNEQWGKFIADHKPGWTHVLGIDENKKSPAAKIYGVRSIPANLLISPEGIIIAKNLRGDALKTKLQEVIQ